VNEGPTEVQQQQGQQQQQGRQQQQQQKGQIAGEPSSSRKRSRGADQAGAYAGSPGEGVKDAAAKQGPRSDQSRRAYGDATVASAGGGSGAGPSGSRAGGDDAPAAQRAGASRHSCQPYLNRDPEAPAVATGCGKPQQQQEQQQQQQQQHVPAADAAPAAQQQQVEEQRGGARQPPLLPVQQLQPTAGSRPASLPQQPPTPESAAAAPAPGAAAAAAVQDQPAPINLFDLLLTASQLPEAASSGLTAVLACKYVPLWDAMPQREQEEKVRCVLEGSCCWLVTS